MEADKTGREPDMSWRPAARERKRPMLKMYFVLLVLPVFFFVVAVELMKHCPPAVVINEPCLGLWW